ncbi:MerR family transcriptional regulator [Ornithinimicrobium avium]|nr:MerR family transcriptional regulator [Ornithinimicrobium avium]
MTQDLNAHDPARGVYGISVAAELVGMAAPSLRLYESHGLLEPDRTPGGTRRYSVDDLERLRTIAELLEDGVNLTGISMILRLREENDQLREENRRLTVSR